MKKAQEPDEAHVKENQPKVSINLPSSYSFVNHPSSVFCSLSHIVCVLVVKKLYKAPNLYKTNA